MCLIYRYLMGCSCPILIGGVRLVNISNPHENQIANLIKNSLHQVFSGVRVTRSLVLCACFVYRCLPLCHFSFGHCIVCSSSIYEFWLPLWYLQTLLKNRKGIIRSCILKDRQYNGIKQIILLRCSQNYHFGFMSDILMNTNTWLFSIVRHLNEYKYMAV